MGFASGDVTEAIDPEGALVGDPAALQAIDAEQLVAACELVKSAVVADDDAGTVTFNLAVPWGPFLATLTSTWGSILDMEWALVRPRHRELGADADHQRHRPVHA